MTGLFNLTDPLGYVQLPCNALPLWFSWVLRVVPRGYYPENLPLDTVEKPVRWDNYLSKTKFWKFRNVPTRFWVDFKSSKYIFSLFSEIAGSDWFVYSNVGQCI